MSLELRSGCHSNVDNPALKLGQIHKKKPAKHCTLNTFLTLTGISWLMKGPNLAEECK